MTLLIKITQTLTGTHTCATLAPTQMHYRFFVRLNPTGGLEVEVLPFAALCVGR